jgi:hypothetical protein
LVELIGPAAYQDHAEEVYERAVPLEVVERIYAHEPLTDGLIRAADPDADHTVVATTARAVGFPVGG